jgi:hypothetical protein
MKHALAYVIGAMLLVACAEETDELNRRPRKGSTDDGAEAAQTVDGNDPALCKAKNREYFNFDKAPLTADRAVTRLGDDRARVKPFSALQTEYQRVLGNTPASLAGSGATFGQVPKNWYEEPQASAVALQTAYDIAFDGCLTYTETAPEFASAPDASSASAQCSAMARKFWSKTPAPQEIQACVDMAVTGTAAEPDPRRRWSYACASILTSAGFLTY